MDPLKPRRQVDPLSKANRKWVALGALPILGITFYWVFTYTGPYRYFAEWQLKWLGMYSPELSAVLAAACLFFGVMAIATVIKLVFRGAERPVSEMQAESIATPAAAPTASPAREAQVAERWLRSCRRAVLYAAPFLFIGVGAYSYYNGTQEGTLQQLTAVDFESGKVKTRALYADVHGHLSASYLVDGDRYRYIPMMSEEKAAGPVRLLVGVNDDEADKYLHREADGTVIVRGVTDKGLPSDLRYAFEKNGFAVADAVWVVHAGRDPWWDRRAGLFTMGFGIAVAGFVFGWQTHQKRKRAAAQAARATA